ncbi:MAG: monofunctional biosynthetic peptidoglycan transglycosylase [Flavisolibacter sp.]|jgi:monofunctional biosynthetic peptidoglycan transglycosylase|nr:monofunctional biosynthetic peptidoglycan transglycosylase [Flavisolibacter sp.]
MNKKQIRNKRTVWGWIKRIFLFLFLLQLFYLIALKWIDPPITLTQLSSWISGDGLKRDYVDDDKISYHMKLAVIASEDQIFIDHGGFDWKSIEKAIRYNEKKPGRMRGGSTISQQVAKNVFLWQGRDFIRKGLEVYFTKMIEWIWGKKRILEVYLNVIEMGRGIYGSEAAAQAYFNKPAKNLTRKEAAMVAACLPNPKKYTVKPLHSYIKVRTPWIMRQMGNLEGDKDILDVIRPKIQPAKK